MIRSWQVAVAVALMVSCARDDRALVAAKAKVGRGQVFCDGSLVGIGFNLPGCRDAERSQVSTDARPWRHQASICFPEQPVVQDWIAALEAVVRFGTPKQARSLRDQFLAAWQGSVREDRVANKWLGPSAPTALPGPADLAAYRAACLAGSAD